MKRDVIEVGMNRGSSMSLALMVDYSSEKFHATLLECIESIVKKLGKTLLAGLCWFWSATVPKSFIVSPGIIRRRES